MKDLYDIADAEGIEVVYAQIPECGSISMDTYICLDSDFTYNGWEERTHLAHELGHCMTGAFYNRYSPCDIRQKYENRADKWAIENIISEVELNKAVNEGYTEVWELAEYFGVSEAFIRKAICWYKNGNLAVDLYF